MKYIKHQKSNISFDWISRMFFAASILYANVLSAAYFYIPYFSLLLSVSAVFFLLLDAQGSIRFNHAFILYLMFGMYALISGLVVAVDRGKVITWIGSYFEAMVDMYLIFAYSDKDRSCRFARDVFILLALLMSFTAILRGVSYNGRVSISSGTNVNMVAVVCAFGIGFLLMRFVSAEKTLFSLLVMVFLILSLLLTIVRTGSRKGILAAGMLIALWCLFCYRTALLKSGVLGRSLIAVLLIFLAGLAYEYLVHYYADSVTFLKDRMEDISGTSNQIRVELMIDSIKVWTEHPFFGVGYNNYRFYSAYGMYSHNLWGETLSCTGLCGFCLFIPPMLSSIARLIRRYATLPAGTSRAECLFSISLWIVFLLLSGTVIMFYDNQLMYILSYLTALAYCGEDDAVHQKENGKWLRSALQSNC